jgi:hypothetical protein
VSECTTCSYYGKHLDGPSEAMPWPCIECAGGEKYVARGQRKRQVPLRVQLAEAEKELASLKNAALPVVLWWEAWREVHPDLEYGDIASAGGSIITADNLNELARICGGLRNA